MKLKVSLIAAATAILTIAGSNANAQEYCTRGEVITGATFGLAVGALYGATAEITSLYRGTSMALANGNKIILNNRMSREKMIQVAEDWGGELLDEAIDMVPGKLVTAAGVAGGVGGGIIGAGAGAFAGCVSGPVIDNVWEGSKLQSAVHGTVDYVGGTADYAWESTKSLASSAGSAISNWWYAPTEIEKSIVVE